MSRFAVARAQTQNAPEQIFLLVPRIESPEGSEVWENAVAAPIEGSLMELRQTLFEMLSLVNAAIAQPETIVEVDGRLLLGDDGDFDIDEEDES